MQNTPIRRQQMRLWRKREIYLAALRGRKIGWWREQAPMVAECKVSTTISSPTIFCFSLSVYTYPAILSSSCLQLTFLCAFKQFMAEYVADRYRRLNDGDDNRLFKIKPEMDVNSIVSDVCYQYHHDEYR